MAIEPVLKVSGTAVQVPGADIDTDRIIPARFMKCVTFDGLGEFAFYDVRFDQDGKPRQHPLNDPRFAGAAILLSGPNFGCGSSREHAPQSLSKFGFRAVIAESFAEIFLGNATTLGMPCVTASKADLETLRQAIEADPTLAVTIDLQEMRAHYGPAASFPVQQPASLREALVSGRWDPIAELLENEALIDQRARALSYV
jgi:3-isopropylmalate/(R)-2-methylmalate dehydratase small subunit